MLMSFEAPHKIWCKIRNFGNSIISDRKYNGSSRDKGYVVKQVVLYRVSAVEAVRWGGVRHTQHSEARRLALRADATVADPLLLPCEPRLRLHRVEDVVHVGLGHHAAHDHLVDHPVHLRSK